MLGDRAGTSAVLQGHQAQTEKPAPGSVSIVFRYVDALLKWPLALIKQLLCILIPLNKVTHVTVR